MDGLVGEDMHIKIHKLEQITNKFGIDRRIATGPYGTVYKGLYNGQAIAVKRLHQLLALDDEEFHNEFLNLCNIRHPNIVRLIGYCHDSQRKFVNLDGKTVAAEARERILCFEYMEGGDLGMHITDEACRLNWPSCFKIIKDTCEGLHHLHSAEGKPIYHLNLSPGNILLNKVKNTAKIGGFGLSMRFSSTLTYKTESRRGPFEGRPPEYIQDGIISKEFDVFSLGVLIIKIMAGNKGYSRRSTMPPEQFIDLVSTNWKGRLLGTSGHSSPREIYVLQVKTCIDIALRCVDANRAERPAIKDIIHELQGLQPRVDEISLDYSEMSQGLSGLQVSACSSLETNSGGATKEQMSQQHASEPAKQHVPATWEDATSFRAVPVFSRSIEDKSQYTTATPRILTFQLLYDITKGFSDEHKIGHGSFGEVYKGELPNGEKIAVKKLRENLMLVNDLQFKNEVLIIENLKHHNIVQFVGYCHETQPVPVEFNGKVILAERQHRTLCFEYLQNGSLRTHLSEVSCGLNWKTRYEIIKGICEGLNYLHNGSEDGRPIFHMDLKPDNILLDENMVPKIADFGLSRLFSRTQSHTTKTSPGTRGYMPPEYIDIHKISNKFDVFSLGVIIVDIMIGPSSRRLEYAETSSDKEYCTLVQENWNRRLKATPSYTSQETDGSLEVKTCIEIALKCIKKDRVERPSISMIVDTLKYIHNAQRSLVVDQASLVKFGLWGGKRGRRRDIKTAPRRLESVTIYSLDVINALEFSYTDCNAQHYTAGPWGGAGGSPNKVQLRPSEVLVELCGTVGPTDEIPNVITSLMLVTDADRYGPFGRGDGTPFRICMQNNCHIVGFFGRADEYVNAVGVYTNQEESLVRVCKVGPWGGRGGSTCDIDVPPHRVQSVMVGCSDHVINSLAFSYSDCNEQHHTAGPWGGIGGEEHKIDLEPYEFLVKVSGTIGEFGGIQNLITSLTMVTNVATYGPFGEVRGTHFDIPVHSKSCIVGFFAQAGTFINAIGVYARPI